MDIGEHWANPHISIEAHTRNRQIELARSLDNRAGVYLDLNYWIRCRKAEAGDGTSDDVELLQLARELARENTIFCPISESVLMELLKQDDLQSRIQTAQLIDDLSRGVAMVPFDTRAATELAHFIHYYNSDPKTLHPLRHLVWLKCCYVLGMVHPSGTVFDAESELAIQKGVFEKIWSMSLVDMIKTFGDTPIPGADTFTDLAKALNTGTAEHADEIRSFAQAYRAESRGAASVFGEAAMQIAQDIARKRNMPFPAAGSQEWQNQERMWENALFQILQKETVRHRLPSLHVQACLHAAFRWNKSRRFEGNDIYDFQHAAAALGFFHRGLAALDDNGE